jgi:hypothetical protein
MENNKQRMSLFFLEYLKNKEHGKIQRTLAQS